MPDEQHTLTLDDSARASNPGNLRVNPLRWFQHYPTWPLIWLVSLLFFVAMALLVHGSFWIVALLLLAMNWLYWQRVRDHFRCGCANPAMVVSIEPLMIAVATDLTMGVGQYPVIKIIDKPLSTVCGQSPQLGSLLPVVSLYRRSPDEDLPHWVDFDPRPIDCATGDVQQMQRVMGTFTNEDWDELRSWLRQAPRPLRPGLYHISPPEGS